MLNRVNPYDKCPVYESRNFLLRLVEENDAEDLIDCYSDPISAKLFNSDNCTSNFIYKTIDEVEDCIKFWLNEYKDQLYVRFSIVDKRDGVLIFSWKHPLHHCVVVEEDRLIFNKEYLSLVPRNI